MFFFTKLKVSMADCVVESKFMLLNVEQIVLVPPMILSLKKSLHSFVIWEMDKSHGIGE